MTDDGLPGLAADLGLPGFFDVHTHFMPDRMQEAVWAHFDDLSDPPWPIRYRYDAAERMATLPKLGIIRHTALAYAHRPGVAAWLNEHTLALAARHPQVVPTFTLYPEPEAPAYVAAALEAGGSCVKVHLQVGKFELTDPRLTEAPHQRDLDTAAVAAGEGRRNQRPDPVRLGLPDRLPAGGRPGRRPGGLRPRRRLTAVGAVGERRRAFRPERRGPGRQGDVVKAKALAEPAAR